jgi:RNA polymerase sigma-70 factor (ECF subfamily)
MSPSRRGEPQRSLSVYFLLALSLVSSMGAQSRTSNGSSYFGSPLKINGLEAGTWQPQAESMSIRAELFCVRFFGWEWGGGSYNWGIRRKVAGVTTLGDLASAIGARAEEAAIVADLKAGSEEAYAWLIGEFQRPVYGLVYRMVSDPADAADTVQDVFLKVFRGMKHFHGESSLKTWIYRIALHEAANRKRWWFRHKAHETSIEPVESDGLAGGDGSMQNSAMQNALTDGHDSPFDSVAHREVQQRVDAELRKVAEPYRTTLILRDLEEMSYEEIAEVLQISLGTVKSRLTRGRQALKQRLAPYVREVGGELGLTVQEDVQVESQVAGGGRRVEVMP